MVLVEAVELAEVGALVLIRVQGSHFLWKMVRRMVGVVAAVGRRELDVHAAADFLTDTAPKSSAPAALAAPAAGLFLEAVLYKGDPSPGPIRPLVHIE